ncbi:hypothetical protein SAMN04489759_103150 [Sulfitobacter delicatus]|uniref:Uncharacterized protein n=1 Tax=Sulfitobacter delicatus TaxID=218672 RepID=A0A1G7NW98_9RHOB|nr:hypothetical protein SAMN04489759_103150 [Sulfitobacter delicatus]
MYLSSRARIGLFKGVKYCRAVMANAILPAAILRVSAKLVEPIGAVRPLENVDANGLPIKIDRADHFVLMRHGLLSGG